MDTRKTLTEKLRAASLSVHEMSLWEEVTQTLQENMLQDILNVFNSRTDGIRMLTDNLVAKTEALKSNDISQWQRVLEKDKSIIHNT